MLNMMKDKEKLINLKNALEEFIDEFDCENVECEDCEHRMACRYMSALYSRLSVRYLKDVIK